MRSDGRGTRLIKQGSAQEGFVLAESRPDARLEGLVRAYEDFEERSPRPLRRREVAVPDVVMIVDFGEGWRVGEREPVERLGSFAAGIHDRPTIVEHGGRARCVQVNLTPLGARALLGVPLVELRNRTVALEELLGSAARGLAERLYSAEGFEQRFALLDEVLAARAADAPPVRADVGWAWRRLVASGGALAVQDLARELGCSRRHLSGRFGEEIGLPPKSYARLLRFRRAFEALLRGGEEGLASVAATCGYADQPHLNREFRALAGTTPGALLASRVPEGGGVLA
jgi:AraC-like DNA-binding protein